MLMMQIMLIIMVIKSPIEWEREQKKKKKKKNVGKNCVCTQLGWAIIEVIWIICLRCGRPGPSPSSSLGE